MKMFKEDKIKKQRMQNRKMRTRKKLLSLITRPRLSVFRSNVRMYAQIIDDSKGITLVAAHENELDKKAGTKIARSEELGMFLAKKALDKKIKKVVFDKGGYRFHGRVKAFADGARKGGLEF